MIGVSWLQGIYVTGVEPFSPADMAGIKVNDRLLTVNNISVVKVPHSAVIAALQTAGGEVPVGIERIKNMDSLETQVRSKRSANDVSVYPALCALTVAIDLRCLKHSRLLNANHLI